MAGGFGEGNETWRGRRRKNRCLYSNSSKKGKEKYGRAMAVLSDKTYRLSDSVALATCLSALAAICVFSHWKRPN